MADTILPVKEDSGPNRSAGALALVELLERREAGRFT